MLKVFETFSACWCEVKGSSWSSALCAGSSCSHAFKGTDTKWCVFAYPQKV